MAIPLFWLMPAVCLLFPSAIQFPHLKYNCSCITIEAQL